MKKKQDINGLSNVFKALENEEFSVDQLDSELLKIGLSGKQLEKVVQERLREIKAPERTEAQISPEIEEFNPFLIAAKKNVKGEKVAKKLKKRP